MWPITAICHHYSEGGREIHPCSIYVSLEVGGGTAPCTPAGAVYGRFANRPYPRPLEIQVFSMPNVYLSCPYLATAVHGQLLIGITKFSAQRHHGVVPLHLRRFVCATTRIYGLCRRLRPAPAAGGRCPLHPRWGHFISPDPLNFRPFSVPNSALSCLFLATAAQQILPIGAESYPRSAAWA
jgi:hypothetical protein